MAAGPIRPWSAPIFCSDAQSSWESTWGSGPVCGRGWGAVFGPLVSFRWGELRYTLPGQKIDGTQF